MKKIAVILSCLMLEGSLWAQNDALVQRIAFPNEESRIEDDYLVHPYDLKVYKGSYYICDAEECCVKVFSANGQFIRKIGRKGQGPGELGTTFKLDIDEESGLIYCADAGNSRIDVFESSGDFRGMIRTLVPPRDVICLKGTIITASYNRILNSLYTMYDSQLRIAKTFGELFDANVPNTPNGLYLYTMANHAKEGSSLYVLFECLPFVSIYSLDGRLVNRLTIDNKDITSIYDKNIVGLKKGPVDGVLGVSPWNRGGCLYKGRYYYLADFKTDEVWEFDLNGKLSRKIPFRDKTRKATYRLVTVDNGKFIFLDWYSGQVQVYEIEQMAR